jgi:hypothetical protein
MKPSNTAYPTGSMSRFVIKHTPKKWTLSQIHIAQPEQKGTKPLLTYWNLLCSANLSFILIYKIIHKLQRREHTSNRMLKETA